MFTILRGMRKIWKLRSSLVLSLSRGDGKKVDKLNKQISNERLEDRG